MSNVIKIERWQCPFCEEEYETIKEAEACAAQGFTPEFQPGDIVVPRSANRKRVEGLPHGRFGWYDGDPDWVYIDEPNVGLHGTRGIDFYYVVGAVTTNKPYDKSIKHIPTYHLFTEAMKNGYRSGWTRQETHIPFAKPECPPPQSVIAAAKKYIGKTATELL